MAVPRSGKSDPKVLVKTTLGGSEYVVKTQGFAHLSYPNDGSVVKVTLGTDGMTVSDGRLTVSDPGLRDLGERIASAAPPTIPREGTTFSQKVGWTPSVALGKKAIRLSGGTEVEVEYALTQEDGHPAVESTVSITKAMAAKGTGTVDVTYGVRVTVERIEHKPDPPALPIPVLKLSTEEAQVILIILAAMAALGAAGPRPRMG